MKRTNKQRFPTKIYCHCQRRYTATPNEDILPRQSKYIYISRQYPLQLRQGTTYNKRKEKGLPKNKLAIATVRIKRTSQ